MTDLTAEATLATRRARLTEQVLLDAVAARAIEEQHSADPKAAPPLGALIGGRPVSGRVGELHLLDGGAAAVLTDSGYIEIREPLTLPAWQRPEVAGELRAVAGELQQAADELDPPAEPPAPTPEPADPRGDV